MNRFPKRLADYRTCDLCNSQSMVCSSLEIDVIAPNTGCEDQLQLLGFLNALSRHLARVEGRGDHDICIRQMLLELCVDV